MRAAAAATNAAIKLEADSDGAPLDDDESLADEEEAKSLLVSDHSASDVEEEEEATPEELTKELCCVDIGCG